MLNFLQIKHNDLFVCIKVKVYIGLQLMRIINCILAKLI